MTCDSSEHKILLITSTLLLILYLVFLLLEQVLYSSNSFEKVVPWSSYDRTAGSYRILIKLILAVSITLDKQGAYRGQIGLACFFIQVYPLFLRLRGAFIFDNSVFYATIIYDTLRAWLFLTISLHTLSTTTLTNDSLSMLAMTGLIFGLILVVS